MRGVSVDVFLVGTQRIASVNTATCRDAAWCVRDNIHFSFVLIQRKVTKEKSRADVFGAIRIKPLAAGAKNSLRSNIRSFPAPGKILTYAPTPRPLAMRMILGLKCKIYNS